jgi:hypothetical protein
MTDSPSIVEFLTARYDEEQRAAEVFRSRDWVASGATVRSGPRVQTAGPAFYSTRMMGEPWPDEICVPLPTGPRPDDFWTLVNLHGTTGKFESEMRHAEYIAYWDPARVLADVAAKRALLALWQKIDSGVYSPDANQVADDIVEQLLAPYGKRAVWTREAGWRVVG